MNEKGQYFTKNVSLQEKVYSFIKNDSKCILEPSVGRGDLVKYVRSKRNVVFDMYEIDKKITFIIDKAPIHFGNFLEVPITKRYKTIIGNPPYVKTKTSNLYIQFIRRCFELLENKGELIFIVPSDFFKVTHARSLLQEMVSCGSFTDLYFPNDEKLFEHASIDVVVFRYEKIYKQVMVNGESKYLIPSNGMITFSTELPILKQRISNLFNVYVGLVTGAEKVFKNNSLGDMSLLIKKNEYSKYIYVKKFPPRKEEVKKYLLKHKSVLMDRKIRKFNETNWYEWGAPRNIKIMEENKGDECIYMYNVTRSVTIAFKGKVGYFGGALLMMKPKRPLHLDSIVQKLNSESFKKTFMYSGRFKISQSQLCESYI